MPEAKAISARDYSPKQRFAVGAANLDEWPVITDKLDTICGTG